MVVCIVHGIPCATWYGVGLSTGNGYLDTVIRQVADSGNSAIRPTMLRVVASEHHLRSNLQTKFFAHGEPLILELSVDSTFIDMLLAGK